MRTLDTSLQKTGYDHLTKTPGETIMGCRNVVKGCIGLILLLGVGEAQAETNLTEKLIKDIEAVIAKDMKGKPGNSADIAAMNTALFSIIVDLDMKYPGELDRVEKIFGADWKL